MEKIINKKRVEVNGHQLPNRKEKEWPSIPNEHPVQQPHPEIVPFHIKPEKNSPNIHPDISPVPPPQIRPAKEDL